MSPAAVLDAVILTEEEQIESAKYLPRELPPRLFEEERFVFPESYGINRVRLLVKDPEWIFAHWDVDPQSMESFRADLGERGMALSRLTLKVADVDNGGSSVILLPYGARSWYVRTDSARRSYKAQLGLTLPSGEFRLLAESNTVTTPRVGPSPVKAARRMSYPQAAAVTREQAVAAARDEGRSAAAEAGPWNPPAAQARVDGSAGPSSAPSAGAKSGALPEKGGASDVYRR
ncbi:MAG: DUF4912 domain-containing protein [Acidobacteria bacterium]|nr:DUF4912 domain-containing protein [Acidobacteriota bacterium]